MNTKEVSLVRIALREMIINAIEHGNLEITFEQKSQALETDSYFLLVADRQKSAEYSIRRVSLDYRITNEKAEYRITDNGNGFNYNAIDERFEESHENMLSHGRGIIMARSVFDSITWNNTGNQVLLIKNFTSD
jgi:anti-sigma regulatory factor (Ser/Thr protein kinase)